MKPDGHEQMKLPSVFWQLYLHGFGVNSHSLMSASTIRCNYNSQYPSSIVIVICSENLTDAIDTRPIGLVAFVANASVGTEGVDALTIPAKIGYGPAFVDI